MQGCCDRSENIRGFDRYAVSYCIWRNYESMVVALCWFAGHNFPSAHHAPYGIRARIFTNISICTGGLKHMRSPSIKQCFPSTLYKTMTENPI